MERRKSHEIKIESASPHTIKKFELIEAYVDGWARKLLGFDGCDGIFFIDCMCNSGIYADGVEGTPIRVSRKLARIAQIYPNKQVYLCFNDFDQQKIDLLKTHLPVQTVNFHIETHAGNGNDLLKVLITRIRQMSQINSLLLYDPYQAAIDWEALSPFLDIWGEVILNHMISDTVRGISQAKRAHTIAKYEETYQTDIEELIKFSGDRKAIEKKINEILSRKQQSKRRRYMAIFPFFNTINGKVYDLIHCTGSIEGFKLFKKVAWTTFGGKSSTKNTHGIEDQYIFNFSGDYTTVTDDDCYNLTDIAKFLAEKFKNKQNVLLDTVWHSLDNHPIFPSDYQLRKIKSELQTYFGVTIRIINGKHTMTFK